MTEQLILHSYDASPFTQKTLRMLGLKGLSWSWVEMPMILPKPDLVALTGGYRGTPVLQIGADIFVDNQRIAMELEKRFPEPSLFPFGNQGLGQAMVIWANAFFRAGLHMAIGLQSADWPEEFLADRKALFDDLDFDAISAEIDQARSQLCALAGQLNSQLSDGRLFLEGDKPSLADIHAFSVPWFARPAMPEVNELLQPFIHLPAWEARIAELGEGQREPVPAAQAHAVAKSSVSKTRAGVDSNEAQGLKVGQSVMVEPDDARRGSVAGTIVTASPNEIAIRHENDSVGEVVVHFPRLGYRVTPS